MSKGSKRFLWTVSILFVLALVIFAAIKVFFPAEKVQAIIVSKIEESLNRPVTVGSAGVNVWGGISLQISDLRVKNHSGFAEEDFITLGKLDVGLKFWPLLKGKFVFNRFNLNELNVNLEKQPGGQINFADLGKHEGKEVEPAAGATSIPFLFDKLELHNARVNFRDDSLGTAYSMGGIDLVSKLTENGFDDSYYAEGDFSVGTASVDQNGKHYEIPDLKFRGDMKLKLDLPHELIAVDKFIVHLADISGQLEGQIGTIFHKPDFDLSFRSKRFNTEQVLALIPRDINPLMEDISGSGEMTFSADLKGKSDETEKVDLSARLLFENINLKSPRVDGDFVIHNGEITVRQKAISFLFESCTFANEPFSAKIYVADFTNPQITAELALSVNLRTFRDYVDEIDEMSGRLYGNINLFTDLKNPENTRADGGIVLEDFRLHHSELPEPIEEVDLECEFKREDIVLEKCEAEIGDSRFRLEGQMLDIIPFLAAPQLGKYKPYLLLDLYADYLNLDQLMAFLPVDTAAYTTAEAARSLENQQPVPSDIGFTDTLPVFSAKGKIRADRGIYTGIQFDDLTAQLDYRDHVLHLEDINANLYDGAATGEIIVDYENLKEPHFQIDLDADSVEINSILTRTTGFDNVLFGKVEMQSSFAGTAGNPQEVIDQLTANGKVTMSEGMIRNFPLLNNIAAQLGLKTFDEQKIRNLYNTFTIKDGKIGFDNFTMMISGTEWSLAGQAGFDGSLDYNLGIKLDRGSLGGSEALQTLGALLGSKDSKVVIPISLTGTYSEPNIQIDRSKLTESADKTLEEEGKKLLNNLFKKN